MIALNVTNQDNGEFLFSGELNRNTVVNGWPEGKKLLSQLKQSNQKARLNLAKISQIDTAGLAWLVNLVAEQNKLGQEITLSNYSPALLKLAKISDVDSLLPLE